MMARRWFSSLTRTSVADRRDTDSLSVSPVLREAFMPSDAFKFIQGKPQSKTPIYAKYNGEPDKRELCPHVLGYAASGTNQSDERVLCYQLASTKYPAPEYPAWRCFIAANLAVDKPPKPQPPKTHWKGPGYSKTQGSVQNATDQTP
jgi:hypothetical protein